MNIYFITYKTDRPICPFTRKLLTMQLRIEKDSRIKDIQQEFSACYPYLKIEFLRDNTVPGQNIAKAEKASPVAFIRELTPLRNPAWINIDSKKTVKEMEEDFQKYLRLTIKIFRKSGNSWVIPFLTNDWSLDKQNKEGESFPLY